jgi:hypothetical protein
MRLGGRRHAPAALPPGKTRYPLYRRRGGPQGRAGRVRKISPLPGFDPPTVQPVASRYTDWAIPANIWKEVEAKSYIPSFFLSSCLYRIYVAALPGLVPIFVCKFKRKLANTEEIKALIHDCSAVTTAIGIFSPVNRESEIHQQPNLT